jgi:hypothetical protein
MSDLPESDEPEKVTLPARDESATDIASLIAATPESPVALQGMEKIRDAWKKGEKKLDYEFEQKLKFERDPDTANRLVAQYMSCAPFSNQYPG